MKALQSAHDAYDARIAATEAIAEAAETAVCKVRSLERKVDAFEADEREGPFVVWCKEAVTTLQGSVEGMKGLRQKVSALDGKMERLGEDVERIRDEGGVVKGVVRRLEVLEGERREEERRVRELEREVLRLRNEGRQRGNSRLPEDEHGGVIEETYDEVQADDNPLTVFYGINTQSPVRRQDHEHISTDARRQYQSPGKLNASFQRLPGRTDNVQPPDADIVRPEDDSFDLLEAAPGARYGWENTQQFKNMQNELFALRAMCRTQESKSGSDTADATQRPQEPQITGRANNINFSDATTEAEADFINNSGSLHHGKSRGSVGALR